MSIIRTVKKSLSDFIYGKKELQPAEAYNLLAATYDGQTDNPLVFLDEIVFNSLLNDLSLKLKVVVDVGCGTGKHWKNILAKNPRELIGYDVSNEMLEVLRQKYPNVKTFVTKDDSLTELRDFSCDVLVSTLVIGYIKDLPAVFNEWSRILKKNGEIIITDFHPDALEKGANRSFEHKDKTIFIKNYIHSLNKIRRLAKKMNWEEVRLIEGKVDARIKPFYINHGSLDVYEKSYNSNLLYGIHFRKTR